MTDHLLSIWDRPYNINEYRRLNVDLESLDITKADKYTDAVIYISSLKAYIDANEMFFDKESPLWTALRQAGSDLATKYLNGKHFGTHNLGHSMFYTIKTLFDMWFPHGYSNYFRIKRGDWSSMTAKTRSWLEHIGGNLYKVLDHLDKVFKVDNHMTAREKRMLIRPFFEWAYTFLIPFCKVEENVMLNQLIPIRDELQAMIDTERERLKRIEEFETSRDSWNALFYVGYELGESFKHDNTYTLPKPYDVGSLTEEELDTDVSLE